MSAFRIVTNHLMAAERRYGAAEQHLLSSIGTKHEQSAVRDMETCKAVRGALQAISEELLRVDA